MLNCPNDKTPLTTVEVGCIKPRFPQQSLHLVMADAASQQASQPGPRGLTKGANQIFAINVQQFVIVPGHVQSQKGLTEVS